MVDSDKPDEFRDPKTVNLEKSSTGDAAPVSSPDEVSAAPTEAVGTPYFETEWTPAYAETEIRGIGDQPPFGTPAPPVPPPSTPQSDPAAFPPNPVYQGFTADPYGQQQGGYAPQQPMPYYPAPVPAYPGLGYGGVNRGPAPATSQVSSILAIVIGGLLTFSCYGFLLGIAPLILGIVGVVKANSVSRLWFMGQEQEAYAAAESSKKMAMWAWIGMAIGLVITIIIVIVFVALYNNSLN
ncbi:hypothetical protein [Gordonia sp. (in: high G+C Gram-positive bacteria)]|uniref:hypothetical protein n=1 Tax=Gordonia sp. (in: high G+C Gram-positive bacteria) TaxID=84139 RepID=UPI003C744E16